MDYNEALEKYLAVVKGRENVEQVRKKMLFCNVLA
tara:strand:+ start:489 stop:593 length:105 start_codon:yes stop_codon:yes gene_type:complete